MQIELLGHATAVSSFNVQLMTEFLIHLMTGSNNTDYHALTNRSPKFLRLMHFSSYLHLQLPFLLSLSYNVIKTSSVFSVPENRTFPELKWMDLSASISKV